MTIVAVVTAFIFAGSGLVKVANVPMSLEQRDELHVQPGLWLLIGVLELLGVAGVAATLLGVTPPIVGAAAAVGFVLLMIGAMITRLRAKSGLPLLAVDVVTLALAVLTACNFAQ